MEDDKYPKNLYMAMLSQQCFNYEEMIKYLEKLVQERNKDFSPEERELLSFGLFQLINTKRNSLHKVMAYETKERKKENSGYLLYLQEYRREIEADLTAVCQKIITTIDSLFFKKAENVEAKIYYKKLKADIYRYMSEYAKDELREKVTKESLTTYQECIKMAKDLSLGNPIILGCHLNLSIYYYEVMNERKTAIKFCSGFYPKAEKDVESIEDKNSERYVEAKKILDNIKKHMEYWEGEEKESQQTESNNYN